MSDLIERLRMLKEIAGIEGGCIGDAAADRIEELERGERANWSTLDAWKEKAESLEAENERLREKLKNALTNYGLPALAEKDDE